MELDPYGCFNPLGICGCSQYYELQFRATSCPILLSYVTLYEV